MNNALRQRMVLLLMSIPVAAALAACGVGAASSDSSAGGAAKDSIAPGASSERLSASAQAPRDGDKAMAADAVIRRAVIATGSLRLTARHLDDVRQDAINVATGLGGHVADEQSRSDAKGSLDRVDLTLRVPAGSFDKALDDLGKLGTVRHREQSVEDVTTQVIDTNARVRAQAASVASIQRLLAQAKTIAEIMSVESQLTSRQAELDSLKQQQKWLADQTSMSTVQLTLERATRTDVAGTGFVSGLEHGWHALGRSTVAVGTAVGAVLPFGIVLALVGGPVWLLVRRRRTPPAVAES